MKIKRNVDRISYEDQEARRRWWHVTSSRPEWRMLNVCRFSFFLNSFQKSFWPKMMTSVELDSDPFTTHPPKKKNCLGASTGCDRPATPTANDLYRRWNRTVPHRRREGKNKRRKGNFSFFFFSSIDPSTPPPLSLSPPSPPVLFTHAPNGYIQIHASVYKRSFDI